MKPYRVLHLVRGLDFGRLSGGAELHAVRVCLNLNKQQVEPRILALHSYGTEVEAEWTRRLEQAGIAVDFGPAEATRTSPKLRPEFARLWSLVTSSRPQIIHSHSERHDLLNALASITHPTHPYAVRTVHLAHQWSTRPVLGASIDRTLFPLVFQGELAVSKAIFDGLKATRLRKQDRLWLCYNGMDAAIFADVDPADSASMPDGVPEPGPRIGIVGRLTEQKGHQYLIEALKIVNEQLPVHLLIIGGGPLEDALRRQGRSLGLGEYIHFLGVRSDVPQLLPYLDLFVLPSLWEGFPTVLLEAMARQVPVIASDISGNRELVIPGETGWLVPPMDSHSLAQAIIEAFSSAKAKDQIVNRAARLAQNYTIENTAACYARVYSSILGV